MKKRNKKAKEIVCATCGRKVNVKKFSNYEAARLWRRTGMCEDCQNELYGIG